MSNLVNRINAHLDSIVTRLSTFIEESPTYAQGTQRQLALEKLGLFKQEVKQAKAEFDQFLTTGIKDEFTNTDPDTFATAQKKVWDVFQELSKKLSTYTGAFVGSWLATAKKDKPDLAKWKNDEGKRVEAHIPNDLVARAFEKHAAVDISVLTTLLADFQDEVHTQIASARSRLGIGVSSAAQASSSKGDHLAALEDDIKKLREAKGGVDVKLTEAQNGMNLLREEKGVLSGRLTAAEQVVEKLESKVNELEGTIVTLRASAHGEKNNTLLEAELRAQLLDAREASRIASVKVETLTSERAELFAKLSAAERAEAELNRKYQELDKKYSEAVAEINKLRAENSGLSAQVAAVKNEKEGAFVQLSETIQQAMGQFDTRSNRSGGKTMSAVSEDAVKDQYVRDSLTDFYSVQEINLLLSIGKLYKQLFRLGAADGAYSPTNAVNAEKNNKVVPSALLDLKNELATVLLEWNSVVLRRSISAQESLTQICDFFEKKYPKQWMPDIVRMFVDSLGAGSSVIPAFRDWSAKATKLYSMGVQSSKGEVREFILVGPQDKEWLQLFKNGQSSEAVAKLQELERRDRDRLSARSSIAMNGAGSSHKEEKAEKSAVTHVM